MFRTSLTYSPKPTVLQLSLLRPGSLPLYPDNRKDLSRTNTKDAQNDGRLSSYLLIPLAIDLGGATDSNPNIGDVVFS